MPAMSSMTPMEKATLYEDAYVEACDEGNLILAWLLMRQVGKNIRKCSTEELRDSIKPINEEKSVEHARLH